MSEFFSKEKKAENRQRILKYLEINAGTSVDGAAVSKEFIGKSEKEIELIYNNFEKIASNRIRIDFFNYLQKRHAVSDGHPENISLKEDDVEILGQTVGDLFYLKSAVFVDTPMFLSVNGGDNRIWSDVKGKIMVASSQPSNQIKKISDILHGRFIVQRILTMIYKTLGTKIVIATHSPDMVSAMQTIAGKEGVLSNTNFYIAQKNTTGKFDYKALSGDTEDIFKSFNVALDKIEEYATGNRQ